MIHTYNVTGMTCSGCKASVEKKLSKLPEVLSVSVDLDTSQVEVEIRERLSILELQNALPEKYKISKPETEDIFKSIDDQAQQNKTELKQLFPLFLIFAYILTASILMNNKLGNVTSFMLDFMGLFYIVFSFFKFLDYKGFPESFKMYDPLAKRISVYGWLYPFIELALGLVFLNRFQIEISLIITLIILGITTFGVTKALLNKSNIQCACLGTALQLPMTKATFIENSIMLTMAAIMLAKIYLK